MVGLVKWEYLSHVIDLKSKATVRIYSKPIKRMELKQFRNSSRKVQNIDIMDKIHR